MIENKKYKKRRKKIDNNSLIQSLFNFRAAFSNSNRKRCIVEEKFGTVKSEIELEGGGWGGRGDF